MKLVASLALPALLSVGANAAGGLGVLRFDVAAAKKRPVSKVVDLLKDMQEQLEKEQEADEEIYEKLACWCETNDKEKTKAIADAESHLANLAAKIDRLTAESAQLNVEIEGLEKEVARNQKSLDVATAIREKQLAEFNDEEKEMLLAIQSLGSAIIVLNKHHKASLVDQKMVAAVVNNQLQQHDHILRSAVTPHQRKVIASFAQDAEKYAPQSGEIFGILNQMKETFEANLAQSQADEKANKIGYAELKVAKEEEIAAGESSLKEKKQILATTDETLAQSNEDREDTTAGLSDDERFLLNLKETCSSSDSQWEERQKERMEEITAVQKALAILSSDEARDNFSKTFNFLQTSSRNVRSQVASILGDVAAKTGNPKLATLAVAARLDAFVKVKKAIDDMVTELVAEKAAEIEHRDYCINGLNENERTTADKVHVKGRLESKVAGLKQEVKQLTDQIAELTGQIAEMNTSLERAQEDRDAQHQVYEGILADQEQTELLLTQALTVLKGMYASPVDESLVQMRKVSAHKQEPPPGLGEYNKNSGATGIVMMIEQIIADTKELQAVTKHDEQVAENDHTKFKTETTESITGKQDTIVDLTSQKAKSEQDLIEVTEELDGANTDLDDLHSVKLGFHGECDYILKNFEVRQEAQAQEIDALREAKQILSGMK